MGPRWSWTYPPPSAIPDDDALTYSAESSDDAGCRGRRLSGDTDLTIRPVAAGEATVTVTATDPDSLSATH